MQNVDAALGRFGVPPFFFEVLLTTTHHTSQKPWQTSHTNNKNHRPNANLMYEHASQPLCPLGILTSADLRWSQSAVPTCQKFFRNSYTAPTPSLQHIIHSNFIPQHLPLTFLHSSLWKIHIPYIHSFLN